MQSALAKFSKGFISKRVHINATDSVTTVDVSEDAGSIMKGSITEGPLYITSSIPLRVVGNHKLMHLSAPKVKQSGSFFLLSGSNSKVERPLIQIDMAVILVFSLRWDRKGIHR